MPQYQCPRCRHIIEVADKVGGRIINCPNCDQPIRLSRGISSVIMFINLKGGVAKTISSVATAECLASKGFRTLLIDADHQCHAGQLLLGEGRQIRCERNRHNLYDLLVNMLKDDFNTDQFESAITRKASNIGGGLAKLAVMPCSIRMDNFSENQAKGGRGDLSNAEFLRHLAKYRSQFRKWADANFDYTIIDCPPSLALQVRFLLSVADSFIVPAIPDRLSVRGSLYLLESLQNRGYRIAGLGTLWSLFRKENSMHCRMVNAVARGVEPLDKLPKPFETIIPNATQIARSAEEGDTPVSFVAKYGEFARKFDALCEEIVRRVEWQRDGQSQPAVAVV